jgi:hypothetical protein
MAIGHVTGESLREIGVIVGCLKPFPLFHRPERAPVCGHHGHAKRVFRGAVHKRVYGVRVGHALSEKNQLVIETATTSMLEPFYLKLLKLSLDY